VDPLQILQSIGRMAESERLHPIPAQIPPPPEDRTALEVWASRHGVLERLTDPASALVPRIYSDLRHLVHPDDRVEDFLWPDWIGSRGRERRAVRAQPWVQRALADSARSYLLDAARATGAVLASRRAFAARAQPPTEPPLLALLERLESARAAIGAHVTPRPLGTYLPSGIQLAMAPIRLVYGEVTQALYDAPGIRVEIPVEAEPLRVSCSCERGRPPGSSGTCTHALSAIEAAIEFLHDPLQPARKRLAEDLATPGWARFLRAFGDELSRAAPAHPPDDVRLAFRIEVRAGLLRVEPLLQKALKRGGFSTGQRVAAGDVARRPELTRDPRDARVIDALTHGLEEIGGSSGPTMSRARVFRALEALMGHPRAFLAERTDAPARIVRSRLRLVLDAQGSELSAALALGGHRFAPAALREAAGRSRHVILIDAATSTVTLCALDDRAEALLSALEQHPARFPAESHDELLLALQPLQESVEIDLPEGLQGEPVEGDRRPVVRLSPREGGPETDAEILVRPAAGGPAFRPGEGPAVVLHALNGRRVAVHRAPEAEGEAAIAVVRAAGAEASGWTWTIADEERVLDLLAVLRDLGDGVTVEWPEEQRRLALGGAALRSALKVRVTDRRDWFGVDGSVTVDGEEVSFAALLEAVRGGRRYVRVGKNRFALIEDELRQRLAGAGDVLFQGRHGIEVGLPGAEALAELVDDPGHLQAAVRFRDLIRRIDAARALDPAVPEGLSAVLRPYQVEGFRWLARLAAWGMGGCLADDMGLGKTVQALALLLERAKLGPALVVAPTSVGPNWLAEAERFAPGLRFALYRDAGRAAMLPKLGPGDVIVTSYGLCTRDAEALAGVRFATLILDEAQAIKNALTRRARAVRGLDADFRVALTGTPVENHLGELWSLMRILAPGLFGSWDQFRDRFAAPIERSRDRERGAALARTVRPFLLRRAKAEVAPELPERTEIARFVDLSAAERRLYDQARRDALAAIASGEGDARFILLAALTRLRRLACHPRLFDDSSTIPSSKLATLVEIIAELRETGHRALVFSQFTTHLALVREALDRDGVTYEYLDGSTPSEERTRRIAAFQSGSADLFLISLKAGGTGLNLTAADTVIHLDPWWNPAVEDQATDRAHRIGQTRAVTVIRLIVRGTIEETVLALHGEKRALSASVFDEEGGPARLSAEDLADLIRAGGEAAIAGAEAGDDEAAGEALGGEIVTDDAASAPAPVRARAEASKADDDRPPSSKPPSNKPPSSHPPRAEEITALPADLEALHAFANRLLDDLAARKQIADRRYDATLRTYERSLRRFAEYAAARAREREAKAGEEPAGAVLDGYIEALVEQRWPAPKSELPVARVVMNHVRAFLARGAS
jgi:superfamily II DNA or RNA helicase